MAISGLESLDGRLLDGLEFCGAAYDAFEAIWSSPKGIEELRLRRSPRAKNLLEEVLPLADFIRACYRLGCRLRIRWLGGNQPFDARVFYRGASVDRMEIPKRQFLEVTTAVHPTRHLVRELCNAEGASFAARGTHRDPKTKKIVSVPIVYEHSEMIAECAALISTRVADKASRSYPPATALLVHCDLGLLILADEWEEIVRAVRANLQSDQAFFQEVVLVHDVHRVAIVASRATP